MIAEAAKESAAYEWELLKKSIEEDKQFLEDQGIRFIVPDKRFRAAMEGGGTHLSAVLPETSGDEGLDRADPEDEPWKEEAMNRLMERAGRWFEGL